MTSELTKALCAFHLSVNTIHKSAKAQYGNFADLPSVLSAVIPALVKNGLVYTQTFQAASESNETYLITTLMHTSGETITSELPMVIGKGRNVLHDWGGSCTYMRRYALLAILGLAADIETDGDLGQPPAETKPKASPSSKPKPAKKEMAAPPPESTASAPLTEDDRQLFFTMMKELDKGALNTLLAEFRVEFGLPDDAKISNEITTEKHAAFLREKLSN